MPFGKGRTTAFPDHAHQVQDKSVVMFLTYRNPYTRVSGIHLMMEGLQPY